MYVFILKHTHTSTHTYTHTHRGCGAVQWQQSGTRGRWVSGFIRDEKWKLKLGIRGDKCSGYLSLPAWTDGVLRSRWIRNHI